MGDYQEEMDVQVEESQEELVFPEIVENEAISGMDWSTVFYDYWFLWLLTSVAGIYVYRWYIAPSIERYMLYLADKEMEAKLHKNPDLVRARQEEMLEARRRMQEKYDADAIRMAEIRKQREEKKRQEMLAKNIGINVGQKLYNAADNRQDSLAPHPNRPDYNPLMGSGSGGYRPARRSCPGSGCG